MAIMKIKKNSKKKVNEPLTITMPVCFDDDTSAEAIEGALKVMAETPFAKLSYPVNTYRYQIEANVPVNDERVVTVGYISAYDPDNQMVSVTIFKNSRDVINELVNPALEIVPSTHDGVFIRIVKFNIVAVGEDEGDEDGLDTPPEVPNGLVMDPPEETDPAE